MKLLPSLTKTKHASVNRSLISGPSSFGCEKFSPEGKIYDHAIRCSIAGLLNVLSNRRRKERERDSGTVTVWKENSMQCTKYSSTDATFTALCNFDQSLHCTIHPAATIVQRCEFLTGVTSYTLNNTLSHSNHRLSHSHACLRSIQQV